MILESSKKLIIASIRNTDISSEMIFEALTREYEKGIQEGIVIGSNQLTALIDAYKKKGS